MATPTTLPAAFTAGQVLTAAQMNNLRGAFRIMQVVATGTSTQVSSTTTTLADTTLTATITPQATSSKILIFANHPVNYRSGTDAGNSLVLALFRGATQVQILKFIGENGTNPLLFSTQMLYVDSPNTTSATTYKTQFANNVAASEVRVQANSYPSGMVLMEISA
jgi:hypothetical protein